MFRFGKRSFFELDEKLNKIQINLENNYKDEAHKAFKESKELFDSKVASGEMSAKEIEKYKKILSDYKKRLENYGHNLHVGW